MDKKIEETREFLQTIGMPKAQQADICCYVILAMAGVKPDMSFCSYKCTFTYIEQQ